MGKSTRASILVFTGDGKGKTTAAAGMALRFLAGGRRVLLARFCKNKPSGEAAFLAQHPLATVVDSARGMTPPRDHPDFPAHAQAARDLFRVVVETAPGFDLLILDEICGALARGLLDEGEVTAFLETLADGQTAALTGRNAPLVLLAMADTVSETHCLKHAYQKGIAARRGVEF